jgi:RNA polymerase sigma-70 factor (ECF subfamily)
MCTWHPERRCLAAWRPAPAGSAEGLAAPPTGPGQPALTAEGVCRQYAPRISSLARRLLNNQADVEDVTQDVLLQVVRKLGTFRGAAELTTWLHRVTVNAALVHRRKRAPQLAREARASLDEVAGQGRRPAGRPPEAGPVRQALDREARALIEQAVARLPEACRQTFVLAEMEGLTNPEVGAAQGLSVAAVKSRLHRARLLLRRALGPRHGEAAAE